MKILVTGGCGYKGHVLIPKLLARGYEIIAFDLQWFGNYLLPHKNLSVIKGDVRDIEEFFEFMNIFDDKIKEGYMESM